MPWNAQTGEFDAPTREFDITLDPEPVVRRRVDWDTAALGLCLLLIATTAFLFLPWTRLPILTTLGVVLILAGCGVIRVVLERRRPDSALVDWLRRSGL